MNRFFGSHAYDNAALWGFVLALIFAGWKITGFSALSWWYICIPLAPIILILVVALVLFLIHLVIN